MASEFSIRNRAEAQFLLFLDGLLHSVIFDSLQLIFEALFSPVDFVPDVEEWGGAQKRA
jgi:hypothetical protein